MTHKQLEAKNRKVMIIKLLTENPELTQTAIGRLVGVSPKYVSHLNRGRELAQKEAVLVRTA